jgi:hypothetical protein
MITLIFYVLVASAQYKDGTHLSGQTFVSLEECETTGKAAQTDVKHDMKFLCRPLAVHIDQVKGTVTTEVMM